MRASNVPDLAAFGDYDGVLQKVGDMQIRPPVRHYFRVLYYVQRIRNTKWCLFALFMTLCIEFQIKAWYPDNFERQAMFALVIAVSVLAAVWFVEYGVLVYGGDPAELFQTQDEEMAIARNIGELVMQATPAIRTNGKDIETNIGALFSMPNQSTATTPSSGASSSSSSSGYRALGVTPMANINDAFPRSLLLPHGQPHRLPPAKGTVRAGLLNFNTNLGRKDGYTKINSE